MPAAPRHARPIRVLLVDDHLTVLWGLARLIETEAPRLRLVGLATDAEQALALARRRTPDVVLLDSLLAGAGTLALASRLCAVGGARVLLLSTAPDPRLLRLARDAGAAAVLAKAGPAERILDAIDAALARPGWLEYGAPLARAARR